jgi:hypothetical protein
MSLRTVTDGGSSSAPLPQDTLASEIVAKVKPQVTASTQPQALSALIRQTAKTLSTSDPSRPIDQDTLTAADQIAMATVLSSRVPSPQAASALDQQLLGQSLIGVGQNTALDDSDKSKIAAMIVASAAGQSNAPQLSTLGHMLATVSASGNLSDSEKSVLQNAITGSDVSKQLGPETVKFLTNFVGTMAKAQQSPKDTKAVAAAQFDMFMIAHGDDPQYLSGAALDNMIGSDIGLKPDVQTPTSGTQAAALLDGTTDLYSGKQLDAIRGIAKQITKAGGAYGGVTALPVVFDASGSKNGPQTHIVWRVTGANGNDQYVDDAGRIYNSMKDYLGGNKLGYGTLVTPSDGHLTIGADGSIESASQTKKEGFWDKVERYGGDVLDGLAVAGAGVLTVAAFVGTDGMATPLLAAAWGSVLTGGAVAATNGVSDLTDRADHGQSWAPGKATLGDYAGIAAGLATPFTGGAAKLGVDALATNGVAIAASSGVQTGVRVVGWTANGVSMASGAYAGDQLVSNWDSLSWDQRLQGGTTLVLGVVGASRQGAEFLNTLGPSGSAAPSVSTPNTNPSTSGVPLAGSPAAGSSGTPAVPPQSGAPAAGGSPAGATTGGNAAGSPPLQTGPADDAPFDDPSDYLTSRTTVIWPSNRIAPPNFDTADTLTIGGGRVFRPPTPGEIYLNIDPAAGADVVADARDMSAVPSGSMNKVVAENVPWQVFTRPEGPVVPGSLPPGIAELARIVKPGGSIDLRLGSEGALRADQVEADLRAAGFTDVQAQFVSPLGTELPANPSTLDLDSGGFEITATKPVAGPLGPNG